MGNCVRKVAQPKHMRLDHTGHEGGSRDRQPEHLREFFVALRRGLKCSIMGNCVRKVAQQKPMRLNNSGHKGGSRDCQPEHLEELFVALRRGLNQYLEIYQAEWDKLVSLRDDMKQSCRLGVLYDLDKQIETIESYTRHLKYHISKVDKLYEAFCVESRLRDGATHMKEAFSSSPSTKGTKKSIGKLDQICKQCTENMSALASQLKNLLGEFHVKLTGVTGFNRLDHGYRYKMSMRYGRQRCSLKGKVNCDFSQSCEKGTRIFKPLIGDLIDIKVMEMRWLRCDALAGKVKFDAKELFTARPLVGSVDVTDRMISVNLEIMWQPFVDDPIPPVSVYI